MVEQRKIGEHTISHDGIFNVNDVFQILKEWIKEYDYKPNEQFHSEKVDDNGKQIMYRINPWKKINDYVMYDVYVKFVLTDVKDVYVEVDGKKKKMSKGSIMFYAYVALTSDYESARESSPMIVFFRSLYDRLIAANEMSKWGATELKETLELKKRMEAYFNFEHFKEVKV